MRIIYESQSFYSFEREEAAKYYVVITETSNDVDIVQKWLSDVDSNYRDLLKALNLGFDRRVETEYNAEDGEIVDETQHWYSIVEATTETIIVKEHIIPSW